MKLEDCRAKIRRAQHHLDTLKSDIGTFFRDHPYRVVIEHEEIFTNAYIARLNEPPTIPADDWSVVIGDCVHNIRCSLDYIAWQFAGADPNDKETLFPIFDTEAGWIARGKNRIKRLPPEARTFIESLQPFKHARPQMEALNGLRILDDADKHKLLTVVAARPDSFDLSLDPRRIPPGKEPTIIWTRNPELVHDAILARVLFPGGLPNMYMEAQFAPEIAFGEGLGFSKVRVIQSLETFIASATSIAGSFDVLSRRLTK
jgi:hypothetical protein